MDKLQMCRICLAENVRMYIVVNKNLHDLYEKLADNPFVTEDNRPILACFICCAQLKKCYRFQKKCLEAEEQFAQMMNEEYERKPLRNQDQFEFFHGFSSTPIKIISKIDVVQTESIFLREPAVCEGLDDIIVPKKEHESDDEIKTVNMYDNYLDIEISPLHNSESDSEDDVPLMEVKTEVEEQQISKRKRKSEMTNSTTVAKKRNLETCRIKLADTIAAEQNKMNPKEIQDTQNRTSKPYIARQPRVQNSINNTSVDIDCSTNSYENFSFVEEKPYKCDVGPNSLEMTYERPFQCNICLRRFNRQAFLKLHKRIHTGEKIYKYDICRHSFSEQFALTKHRLIHTGEKPYKCDICQYSFRLKGALKQHKLVHTGEKPYQCHICQSGFSQKSSLTRHIYIHTDEKPYKCDICQRSFRQTFSLTRHMQLHTDKTLVNKLCKT